MPLLFLTRITIITIFSIKSTSISHVISKRITRLCLFSPFIFNCTIVHNPSAYFRHKLYCSVHKKRHLTALNSSVAHISKEMSDKLVIKDHSTHKFSPDPQFIAKRLALFQQLYEAQQTKLDSDQTLI